MSHNELSPSLALAHAHMPMAFRRAIAAVAEARDKLQRRIRKYEAMLRLSEHANELTGELRACREAARATFGEHTRQFSLADRKFSNDVTIHLHWRAAATSTAQAAIREFSASLTEVRAAIECANGWSVVVDPEPFKELERMVQEEYFPRTPDTDDRQDSSQGTDEPTPAGLAEPTAGTLLTMIEIDRQIYDLLRPAELRSKRARWY